MSLRDKVCVVTGGGRGLGADTARFLARKGALIAVCARSAADLERLTQELAGTGAEVMASVADVTDAQGMGRFAQDVVVKFGAPTLLVNNAAVLGPVGPLLECDPSAWRRTLETNVVGTVNAIQSFGPSMRTGGGTIVNLSGGGIGGPGVAPSISAYTTSKAAIVQLTETLAIELAGDAINVVAIAPGALATTFTDGILEAGPGVAGDALFEATRRNRSAPSPIDGFEQLLEFVTGAGRWLTGVLLSARWDPPATLGERREQVLGGSMYRLRRIDDELYGEVVRR